MITLLDIVPVTAKVPVPIADGTMADIECHGISIQGVVNLIGRFPDLQAMLPGGPGGPVDPQSVIQAVPGALAAVLVAGTPGVLDGASMGSTDELKMGQERAEIAATALPVDVQVDLLEAILKLTMPQGLAPLMDRLTAMFGAVGDGRVLSTVSGAASQVLPNGKELDTTSP